MWDFIPLPERFPGVICNLGKGMMRLTCKRCGIDIILKQNALSKRVERNFPTSWLCEACAYMWRRENAR